MELAGQGQRGCGWDGVGAGRMSEIAGLAMGRRNGRAARCVLNEAGRMTGLLRRTLLLVAALCLAGCLSPTLPLPPPGEPEVTSSEVAGMVRVEGIAKPYAEVICWNHNNDVIAGQVTRDDPSFSFLIQAEPKDNLELWFIQGDDESSSVKFSVPETL